MIKKSTRLAFLSVFLFAFLSVFCGNSSAVLKEADIEGRPGLSFKNIIYGWDSLFVDIVNMTPHNLDFGCTMVFINKYGEPIARAEILPERLEHRSVKRYIGRFVLGSGEEAKRAVNLLWEFRPRRP